MACTLCTKVKSIALNEELWDSIASDESKVPVLESHKEDMDKRRKKYESAPGNPLSLKELQARIKKRK